jgi:predicted nucleic acid-binding protein
VSGDVEMVWSDILVMENHDNPHIKRRIVIDNFSKYATDYITLNDEIMKVSSEIKATGIREKDSLHIACAIYAECDYVITTDDRMTKLKRQDIDVVGPVKFVDLWKGRVKND